MAGFDPLKLLDIMEQCKPPVGVPASRIRADGIDLFKITPAGDILMLPSTVEQLAPDDFALIVTTLEAKGRKITVLGDNN